MAAAGNPGPVAVQRPDVDHDVTFEHVPVHRMAGAEFDRDKHAFGQNMAPSQTAIVD